MAKPRYAVELRNRDSNIVKILTKDIKNLTWEYNRLGGYGRCTMTLPISYDELDDYISPDYDIQIYLPNEANDGTNLVYRGYAESYKPEALNPDKVTLQFFGYVGQLKRIRVNETYTSEDVNDIVKDVIQNFVADDTDIIYDASLIDGPTFTVDTITFDETADGVMKTLSELAGSVEWGVGSDRKFFFKTRNDTIRHYVRFKKGIGKFDIINDYSQIINRLVIKGASSFVEVVDNTESQNNYGLRTKITSNTAISSSSVAQQYGTSILAEKAAINSRGNVSLVNNKKLFEEVIPIGRVSILTDSIVKAKIYNETAAIYGEVNYGGQQSFQIDKIKYTLDGEGTRVLMNIGQARPDIALQIRRLEYEIDQLRNA